MSSGIVYLFSIVLPVAVVLVGMSLQLRFQAKRQGKKEAVEPQPESGQSQKPKKKVQQAPETDSVAEFYDATTDDFQKVYGDVIQAFRTHDLSNLLDYQAKMIGLEKGMVAIDAGCGVAGPACHFAQKTGARIEAVTISGVQAEKARAKVQSEDLENQVSVHHGDYHQLQGQFAENSVDRVYFLESFGHSHDKAKAIDSAFKVLKPGGKIYIKDLFLKEALRPEHKAVMDREVKRINDAYHYQIGDLYKVLAHFRKTGWILSQVKTVDLPLEDFENLSISNEFQELTGIGRIDSWDDYIFPVEFYEIVAVKPWYEKEAGKNRFFLQNLYYMQVHGKSEAEMDAMKMNPEDQT